MDFRKATLEDIDMLVTTRIEVLRAANGLDAGVDMSEVEKESREYYSRALTDNTHTAFSIRWRYICRCRRCELFQGHAYLP